jgi:hypothetical protein
MRLPPVKLDHLERLTDGTGILQFAQFGVGDPHSGYTTDDNTRALIVAARLPRGPARESLASTYLKFLLYAQRPDGMLAHEVSYERSPSQLSASDDGFGRCLWACGEVVASDLPEAMKGAAASIFQRALPHLTDIRHPRGWANAIQGLALWASHVDAGMVSDAAVKCAEHLLSRIKLHSVPEWVWFEDILTYEPGRLPLGLLYAGAVTGDNRYLEVGERVLAFLERTLFEVTPRRRVFSAIGNRGWYRRGGARAVYDQQPIDAASMVEAATAAAVMTKDPRYRSLARDAFAWFLGANTVGMPLYDPETGACHDGLTPHGVNLNAGSESTICYLIARLTIAAKAYPISRLLAGRPRALELRGARRVESAREPPAQHSPPVRPTA